MAKAKDDRYLVLKDSSEKKGWSFLETATCRGTVVKNLYTGDYSLSGYYDNYRFVIERKNSVTELVGNLTNKEKWDDFKQELERLEKFEHPFVVCEFPFSLLSKYPKDSTLPKYLWKRIKITPQFLMKRIEEIFLRFKTQWLFCDNEKLAKEVVLGLFKRVIDEYSD
jgi:hypothetical protein